MNKYDRKHIANVRAYQRQIDQIFKIAAEESAALAAGLSAPDGGVFSFSSVPRLKKAIDVLQAQMATRLQKTVVDGVNTEWALSNNKNDELVDSVLPESSRKARYYRTNNEARDAFLARKEGGMNLSDRVWRYTDQFKSEIEMGIDCGLRDSLDADAMALQLKQYLQYPDKLFRRVRDEHGLLQLSKAAAAFHPGRGVYRSSYKNARRLAATETNIAYRTADHVRWQQLDFIVGIEIHLSNNHTCLDRKGKPKPFYDICDELKGKYPKDFKFTGWHPHCRCIATTIFKTDEEMAADEERILNGEQPTDPGESENAVKELPDNFNKWVEDNEERIARAKSMPYFIKDNEGMISGDRVAGSMAGDRIKSFINHLTLKEDTAAEQAATAFTSRQIANHAEVSRAIGLDQGERKSFKDADSNRTNPNYSWFDAFLNRQTTYNTNCTITVAIHELRMRGWDVTALPLDRRSEIMMKMFRGNTNVLWIDPATGKPPKAISVFGKDLEKTMQRFDVQTAAVGRYHVKFYWEKRQGHILCVDRLPNGEMRVYDPQNNLLNISDWMDGVNLKKGLSVTKVDGMLINPEAVAKIVKRR